MGRTLIAIVVAALCATPATAGTSDEARGIGESPPDLTGVEWVQGKKLKRVSRGTTYVLCFWSTWAAESRRHLPELESLRSNYAKRRVEVVAIATLPIFGETPPDVFLDKHEGAYGFSVARDKNNATYEAFKKVVDLRALPCLVIIDAKGRIAWTGHPCDELRAVLEAVLDGDSKALAALATRRAEVAEKNAEFLERLGKLTKWEMWEKIPPLVEEMLALAPDLDAPYALRAYYASLEAKKPEQAAAWGGRIVDELLVDADMYLDDLAWSIVRPDSSLPDDQRDLDLARRAAERAHALSGGHDWSMLDTLARVRWLEGKADEAVALQQQAVAEAFSSDQKEMAGLRLRVYAEGEQVDPGTLARKR